MIKKRLFITLTAGLLSAFAAFPAMAGTWKTGTGANAARWWYDNGDTTWAANGWRWIDGNQDGISECYYFDTDGWLLTSTATPDGYTVDANGAWTVNGVVQTKQSSAQKTDEESWDDFQNGTSSTSSSSKKSSKKKTQPTTAYDSSSYTSGSSDSNSSDSDDSDGSSSSSSSHSSSTSSGPSKEVTSSSGDKKPDAPKKTNQQPDSSYRQGSVTEEEITASETAGE